MLTTCSKLGLLHSSALMHASATAATSSQPSLHQAGTAGDPPSFMTCTATWIWERPGKGQDRVSSSHRHTPKL
eukprot:CAMPEP_0182486160 /NCGR_PEP_ID=MMETSP1319-20130603/46541_1 /TAXON_ID=172717 /ORGANISM="Bolidomonas pacifica, Strain RCC208" /LENGTH=72 /DNA_ID=CAMNT_0024688223 /DNA_START=22 /DNA_END=240 /DNA_ORIENTATION=+